MMTSKDILYFLHDRHCVLEICPHSSIVRSQTLTRVKFSNINKSERIDCIKKAIKSLIEIQSIVVFYRENTIVYDLAEFAYKYNVWINKAPFKNVLETIHNSLDNNDVIDFKIKISLPDPALVLVAFNENLDINTGSANGLFSNWKVRVTVPESMYLKNAHSEYLDGFRIEERRSPLHLYKDNAPSTFYMCFDIDHFTKKIEDVKKYLSIVKLYTAEKILPIVTIPQNYKNDDIKNGMYEKIFDLNQLLGT